jgi:phage shock protein PspC (stress-responsive transcriptional regulator)
MKLFGRTGGYYLFWAGAIYIVVGIANAFLHLMDPTLLSVIWILCLLVPLTIKSVADYFNMSTIWDQLRPRKSKMYDNLEDNVYNLPPPKLVPPRPEVKEPVEPAYQIGRTEDGLITLRMGTNHQWSQITMNEDGVDTLIRMLEAAKD